METTRYLSLAQGYPGLGQENFDQKIKIKIVTNFTDKIIEKMLIGLCVEQGIYPEVFAVPYKQYDFFLANRQSDLYSQTADITYIFFDASVYQHSPFSDHKSGHFSEILENLKEYCRAKSGVVILNTLPFPSSGPYGNLFEEFHLHQHLADCNAELKQLAKEFPSVYLLDTNRLLASFGERSARDMRGMYAFDIPFSNDFSLALAKEWFSYIAQLRGKIKKCIVVDLDNTLWGGVVGEAGPLGIALGPQYPGVAFQNFQRALLECYNRGILLAVNSKNNEADVFEVFEKNPHMILKKEHFAASRINWQNKDQNIVSIAEELNIGVDSLVFIDDDPLNREMVSQIPGVLVPHFSIPPELYVSTLFSLPIFNQFRLTEEDKEKGIMYSQEKQRKEVKINTTSVEDYVATLGLSVHIKCNDVATLPRLAQLTQKTNQFNVTTRRYSEDQVREFMKNGLVYSAEVADKFGPYGITILAMVNFVDLHTAEIDNFLMSCRVMGRGVERVFLKHILKELEKKGISEVRTSFKPTAKNEPAKEFFAGLSFTEVERDIEGAVQYSMRLSQATEPFTIYSSIKVIC